MTNIIKTAIITIIISFISGLLLEYYKNLAPRILCAIKSSMPVRINSKKLCAYVVNVSNVSNKTIHDLTLYIQSSQANLRFTNAKITKGLKFDSSINNNTLDINIPFLSKDDKFSVTVYSDNEYKMIKPTIILRSPEKFKQIESLKQNGLLYTLFTIPKNISALMSNASKKTESMVSNENNDFTMIMDRSLINDRSLNKENEKISYKSKKTSKGKKGILVVVSIALLVFVGVLAKSYFKVTPNNAANSKEKTMVHPQSTDTKNSSGVSNKNANSKASNGRSTENMNSKTSNEKSTENTNLKASNNEATKNADLKASTNSSGNTGSKTSTEGTSKNTDSKASTEGSTQNTDSKASTGDSSGNTGSKASTGGSTENTAPKTSSTGSSGTTGN
ncbi:membrane protein [Clostridium drakei]|uniref:Uncharacterized protein n=1 Tax=Clostridium drakei TaxID=332101 RepID=A0A2U8DRI7_9CLOT|nr:membrane protein [Clostridium drakei]AWI04844.1 hypothetical protein B9W14_10170 [Clostridium drakei]